MSFFAVSFEGDVSDGAHVAFRKAGIVGAFKLFALDGHVVESHAVDGFARCAVVAFPSVEMYLVGNVAAAVVKRTYVLVGDVADAARCCLVAGERTKPEIRLEACGNESLTMVDIDVLVADIAEIGAVNATDGHCCPFVKCLMVVGIIIREEYATVHEPDVLVQGAVVFGSYTHGTVAVVPQLHAAECQIAVGVTLGRFLAAQSLDGYGIIVGAYKGVEEGTLLAVDDVKAICACVACTNDFHMLELHIPTVREGNLPSL